MSESLTYKGEALLLSWSDSAAGRKVTFLLPEDGISHPFKDYKSGPKYGQAFAIGCAPIDYDNPEPAKPGDPVKSVAGYAKPPMTESQRCGMLCADKAFQEWLENSYYFAWNDSCLSAPALTADEAAAETVRRMIGIKSRRELDLDTNELAVARWRSIAAQFEAATGRMAERTR